MDIREIEKRVYEMEQILNKLMRHSDILYKISKFFKTRNEDISSFEGIEILKASLNLEKALKLIPSIDKLIEDFQIVAKDHSIPESDLKNLTKRLYDIIDSNSVIKNNSKYTYEFIVKEANSPNKAEIPLFLEDTIKIEHPEEDDLKIEPEEIKKMFYSLIDENENGVVSKKLKSKIELTIQTKVKYFTRTLYDIFKYHYSHDNSLIKFNCLLDYTYEHALYERKKFYLLNSKVEDNEKMDSLQIAYFFNRLIIYSNEREVTYKEEPLPTIEILGAVYNIILGLEKINNSITYYTDMLSISNLKREKNRIIIEQKNSSKEYICSQELIDYIFFKLETIRNLNCIYNIAELKEKIKELNTLKKKHIHLLIKNIAVVLIKNKIMTYISTNGNKYNLFNEAGDPIGLPRKDALLIFDLLEIFEVELTKTKGVDKDKEILYYDKVDYIKERLENAKTLNIYDIPKIEDIFWDFI